MASIIFTVTIIRKDKGSYFARADELSIAVGPASTQRGSLKQLKEAMLLRLHKATEDGTLADFLAAGGYLTELGYVPDVRLTAYSYDQQTVELPLPRRKKAA